MALAAQGFGGLAPAAPDGSDFKRLTRRLGALQIDSVNVLVRSHYLPAFSRLGGYDRTLLEKAAYDGRRRHLFEYWGHEASLLPVELWPLFRWRMESARLGERVWSGIAATGRDKATFCRTVLETIRREGPIAASEIEGAGARAGPWWGWNEEKRACEFLFWSGELTTATRRNFERVYDLPERVLPRAVLAAPVPDRASAQRALVSIAASALGVATEPDLRDYFRLPPADSRARVAELVEDGTLAPVIVKGWEQPAYLHAKARMPRRIGARALLSPFDSLVWDRSRTERVFDFHYRIALYTPKHKRTHGYYVLPFLLGDRLVARVDLKADRGNKTLLVAGAHHEPRQDPGIIAPSLLVSV
jgi:hypothetical protein